MKLLKVIFLLLTFHCAFKSPVKAQRIDTSVAVGNGYRMHFTVIKGNRPPILFESGFGNGGEVWKSIAPLVAEATDATIITYDRLTYSSNMKDYLIPLETETKALETGLKKLGFAGKDIMLVAHSLGGMYCSAYASRHPSEVKAAVFIDDANVCSLTAHFEKVKITGQDTIEQYLSGVLKAVKNNVMPPNIPLTDIVADTHFDDEGRTDTTWLGCHKDFVAQSAARRLLLAYNVGHYVFVENPPLVVNAIITQYASYLAPGHKTLILEKGMALASKMDNELKKNEVKCGHSEEDLTTWGYSYLEKGEVQKAIEVFKLNVLLHPEGWNTYDSLGEAYLKAGNKAEAAANYRKSLELNPKNENAKKVLEKL